MNNLTNRDHTQLQAEINRCNIAKGWFDQPVSFIEAMGLLMTEVVEADEAFSDKSQFASELADCYIRLADDCTRWGFSLAGLIDCYKHSFELQADTSTFAMRLIYRIRGVIEAYRKHGLDEDGIAGLEIGRALAYFYFQLQWTCDAYSIDLPAAVDTKIAKNWTREYRHGNKFA